LIAAARATSATSTSLTISFPGTNGGAYAGLSGGAVTVEVWNQTGASSWSYVGSTSLTVNDTRTAQSNVNSIAPNTIDLATPPATFSLAGMGFTDLGFGLPVANFVRNGGILAAARATSGTNSNLTISFPGTNGGAYPGLSGGLVAVEVWNQTGPSSWSYVGSIFLTVNDTRPTGVSFITPSPMDLATPPGTFSLVGMGFVDLGFGLPVANFVRNGGILAATRATSKTDTDLIIPFPGTNGGLYPGLSAGPVTVEVWNQTGSNNWRFIGSTVLTVSDSLPGTM